MHFDSNDAKDAKGREDEDLAGVTRANVLGGVIRKSFAGFLRRIVRRWKMQSLLLLDSGNSNPLMNSHKLQKERSHMKPPDCMDSFFFLSFSLQHKLNLCFKRIFCPLFSAFFFFANKPDGKEGRKTKNVPFTDAVARMNKLKSYQTLMSARTVNETLSLQSCIEINFNYELSL